MRRHRLALLSAIALVITITATYAADTTVGSLTIAHPWARPTDAMAKTGAAYLVVKNAGDTEDRLVSVSTPIADTADLHTVVNNDGMLSMRPVEGGIAIPAKGTTVLKPGAFHVMLMGPKQQLKPGQSFPMTLTFAKAGAVTVQVMVEKGRGMAGRMKMDHGNMNHDDMKMDQGGMKR